MDSPMTELTRHWLLDGVITGPALQRSNTRTTVAIHSDQGRFVVKTYDEAPALGLVHPSAAEIDQHLSIFDHLADTGFGHAPVLLRTRLQERFAHSDGRIIYVLQQIAGSIPPDTPGTWAEFGRLAARLNANPDYPHAYGIPVAGTIAELTRQARDYPFEHEFLDLVATLGVLANQPTGLIHAEINPANAILSPDGRLTLLDWDQAGTGPWVLEAGYPLLAHFLTEDLAFHRESAAAFYDTYTGGRGLTADQRELVFTAALLHALRYLRFGDPARRWARIRFALAHRDEFLAAMTEILGP